MNPKIIFIFLLIILVFYSNKVDGRGKGGPPKRGQSCATKGHACTSRLPCCNDKQKCNNGGNPKNGDYCHDP
uniref:Uncharacterized protein n=1 Tax=Meloidogyne enterolobii TaxID=390850 RepID=A0A6V7X0S5_MELEN|nr:unnamed protein product [Meloidogyne enterolobii]